MYEAWKTIILLDIGETYKNYMISNLGRVKRCYKSGKEKILKPYKDKKGYLTISLSKNNKSKIFKIHRLVGFAFVEGWFEGATIDHIDTNKENNIWTNLRWTTNKENSNNELSKKHCSESHKGNIFSDEHKRNIGEANKGKHTTKVYCIELNKVFDSIKEANEIFNISKGNIAYVCNGKAKTAGGYHWMYYEDYLNNPEKAKEIINEGKSNDKKVYCIELDRVFNSIKEASEELGINRSSIGSVCNGKRKSAEGYHFIFR